MQVDNLHISYTRSDTPKLEDRNSIADREKSQNTNTESDLGSELLSLEKKVDPAEASRKRIVEKSSFQQNPFPTYNARYKLNPVINHGNYVINFMI